MAEKRAFSGARAVLRVNGKEIGYATGVNGTETIDYQPIEVLGEVDVVEYEVVARRVNFTASFVRIIDASLFAQGIFPKSGQGTTADLVNFPPMEADIFDTVSDKPMYRFAGVKPTTRSFTIDRGSVMTVNASFVATRMLDESNA